MFKLMSSDDQYVVHHMICAPCSSRFQTANPSTPLQRQIQCAVMNTYAFWLAVDSSAASDIKQVADVLSLSMLPSHVTSSYNLTWSVTSRSWRQLLRGDYRQCTIPPWFWVALFVTLCDLSCTHPWSPELHPTAWKRCHSFFFMLWASTNLGAKKRREKEEESSRLQLSASILSQNAKNHHYSSRD